jgi:hypothetical protein|uniref:Uncharacterized protein n=1 Tax=Mus musculus TaxID=10090 RepID=Q3TYF0_MOUSE|nr:unnamed protein product [Mus musculus]
MEVGGLKTTKWVRREVPEILCGPWLRLFLVAAAVAEGNHPVRHPGAGPRR